MLLLLLLGNEFAGPVQTVATPSQNATPDCWSSAALFTYCRGRCLALTSWLSMGVAEGGWYTNYNEYLFEEWRELGICTMCPTTCFNARVFHLYQSIIEQNNSLSSTELLAVEFLIQDVFANDKLNITQYFDPFLVSPSAFMYLHRLAQGVEHKLVPKPSTQLPFRVYKPSNLINLSTLALLRTAVAEDTEFPKPPHKNLKREVAAMQRCSVDDLALGLVDVVNDREEIAQHAMGSFVSDPQDAKEARIRAHHRLAIAQRCLAKLAAEAALVRNVLFHRSPLFGVLDRIDCPTQVPVWSERGMFGRFAPGFLMHVLGIRDHESNYVRSTRRFHCRPVIKNMMRNYHEAISGRQMMMAEIGAYLGGCSLWALTHLPETRIVAVDQFAPAVAAMAKTAEVNSLKHMFTPLAACVSDKNVPLTFTYKQHGGLRQPTPDPLTVQVDVPRPCRALPEVLAPYLASAASWDIIYINTVGHELPVVRSMLSHIPFGWVRTLLVNLSKMNPGDDNYVTMARLLLQAGATLTAAAVGSSIPISDDAQLQNLTILDTLVANFNAERGTEWTKNTEILLNMIT